MRLPSRPVPAAPMGERRLLRAFLEAHDRAEHNRVRMPFDDFLDQAIECAERVSEDRSAGRERGPASVGEAPLAVYAAPAAETVRERLVPGGEKVNRKGGCSTYARKSRGRAREANEQRRRRQRQRRKRGDGAPNAVVSVSAGDDGDAGGQRPHSMAKCAAIGMMEASLAHAAVPFRRRPIGAAAAVIAQTSDLSAPESRRAKACASIEVPSRRRSECPSRLFMMRPGCGSIAAGCRLKSTRRRRCARTAHLPTA